MKGLQSNSTKGSRPTSEVKSESNANPTAAVIGAAEENRERLRLRFEWKRKVGEWRMSRTNEQRRVRCLQYSQEARRPASQSLTPGRPLVGFVLYGEVSPGASRSVGVLWPGVTRHTVERYRTCSTLPGAASPRLRQVTRVWV